jgi:hypothetical protein
VTDTVTGASPDGDATHDVVRPITTVTPAVRAAAQVIRDWMTARPGEPQPTCKQIESIADISHGTAVATRRHLIDNGEMTA